MSVTILPIQRFEMVAGDTKPMGILVTDQDGNPIDLSGGSAKLAFAHRVGGNALFEKDGNFPVSPTNRVNFEIDPADTETLFGVYYWEVSFVDAVGRRSTVSRGFVTILRQSIVAA